MLTRAFRWTRWRRAAEPARWVTARAFDPGFPEADSAYHALRFASNGWLYLTLCTHRIDRHARIGAFDPVTERMRFVVDVGEAVADEPHALPHGKIHVSPAEAGGRLYLATMLGYYNPDRRGRGPYPGFHLLSLDLDTHTLTDLARGPEGEGLITGILDPRRLVYHGLSYPSGLFCRYHPGGGGLTVSPRPGDNAPIGMKIHGRPLYPICRSLGLDDEGTVYGSCRDGTIWGAEPDGAPRILSGLNVADGALPPIDALGRQNSFWRVVVWNSGHRCFYGLHAGTASLFRFDPRARRIEPLARLTPAALAGSSRAPFGSQLGLTCGRGRMLHHLAHGPAVALAGRRTPRTNAYLVSYDLESEVRLDHGPLRTEDGDRVLFAESLAEGPGGDLYTVAWVEVSGDEARRRYRRLRAEASNGECRGETYRMMLLRIPGGALARGGA